MLRIKPYLLFILLIGIIGKIKGQDTRLIPLRNGVVKIAADWSGVDVREELEKGKWGKKYYTLVYYNQLPSATQLKALQETGGEILESLGNQLYLASFDRIPSLNELQKNGVLSLQHRPAHLKLSTDLQKRLLEKPGNDELMNVSVLVEKDAWSVEFEKGLQKIGLEVTNKSYLSHGLIIGMISASKLPLLSAIGCVRYVNFYNYKQETLLQSEKGAFGISLLQGNQFSGRRLNGEGITIGMGDNADPTGHLDLQKKVINRNPSQIIIPPANGSDHGTRVSGILSGDGLIDERYLGIAPASNLIVDDFDFIVSKSAVYQKDFGMSVTNNSYYIGLNGCVGNSDYNELSVFADEQLYNNPTLQHIFAAGNDGRLVCSPYPDNFGTIKSGYQTAKNVLTVGNYNINGNPPFLVLASSKGPVRDGRLKPEIIASGAGFWTTSMGNTFYAEGFGTSFASPLVTGVWSLLTQRYKQLHKDSLPVSALLKAALCNTAVDKGNQGPDFKHGFGLMNPVRALKVIESKNYFLDSLTQGQKKNHMLFVPPGTKRVKIMLYWTDPPGSPMAPTALQQDLDLSVKVGNTTFLPWILDTSNNKLNNLATRGIDRLNNIEQVTIDNPQGNELQVEVTGYSMVKSKQSYVITWEILNDALTITHPIGGEKFTTTSTTSTNEPISWDVIDDAADSIRLEYSVDNGISWNLIAENIPANQFWYFWSVPNLSAANAKVRVTRMKTGESSVTPGTFTIVPRPAVAPTIPCEGAVDLSWNAIDKASDYEILNLIDYNWKQMAITKELKYSIRGLNPSNQYWFAVRPRITDSLGRRSIAIPVIPQITSPCISSEFDKDLKIDELIAPVNGRKFTSSALGAADTVSVSIKNLDNEPSSNNYEVSYQVNNGAIFKENATVVIAPFSVATFKFNTKANLAATGDYRFKIWVKQVGDQRPENDTLEVLIRHISNNPLQLPAMEDFEKTNQNEYIQNQFALEQLERFDLFTSSPYGRARTFVNTGMALNGNRSLTLDAAQFRGGINTNYLLGTFNFSQIPLSKGLRFEFLYKNQGQLKLPNGTLWLRGDDQSPWINAYPILNDQDALASVRKGWINIYDLLSKNQQNLSSSFQILFEQTGYTSANNASYEVYNFNQDDGITLDDLKFTDAKGDIHLVSVISPDSALCAQPNSGSIVSVRIRNYDNAIISNIPVTYRVGNLTPVTEIIPSIPANQELVYSFKTPVSNLPFGNHLMDVWVASAQDNFRSNDSILQYKVYASPVIATFPYRETFESDNGGWFTSSKYSSWTWGTLSSFSAKTFIRGAANGKKGWVTNLLEYYYPNEQSYLYSPCFNIAGLKSPVLSFSHIVAQEYARDFHTIEYSVNNGSSWIRLGLKDKGTNWFDSSALLWNNSIVRWHVSSSDLPVGATSIRFRFLFSSNGSNQFDGIGIDDVHIFDKETIYTGNNTSATQNVSGNNWTHFYSQGSIIASLHPMGQNLGNVNVKVFINQDSVRQINNQYYLDRNIVVDAASAPTDSVRIRIYYTENEVVKMINTTKCSNCIKLEDAYQTAVTQYSGFSQFENGILNDGNDGVYTFIPAENVDIVPFNNGYYAEFKVKSFSEFWLHRSDFKLIQNTTSIAENTIQESFIRSVQLLDNGSLSVVTANHPSIHEMKLRLFNGGGQEVWSSQKAYRQFEEWIPNLSPGIYFLTITDKSGKFTYQTKLIRNR